MSRANVLISLIHRGEVVRHLLRVIVPVLFLGTYARGAMTREPSFRQNPQPAIRDEVTMTIDRAPGPFDSVEVNVLYQVANSQCIRMLRGSGATPVLEKSIRIDLERVGNDRYEGEMVADLMQDEDYYGLGVCHWIVESVNAEATINSLVLGAGIVMADSNAPRTVERFFANRSYYDSKQKRVITGNANRQDFGADANDTFSIVLSVKEGPR
ncbi:hypothetical protein PQR66_09505 [Paraburkholderia agricolaris]|jgi:hypothetical protein|uniref:Uncharacterized protein n=1 Tax=Paraburkholderia agricolaris TaxID=2152888 RepID=A0ABW8ZKZ1_9BURK